MDYKNEILKAINPINEILYGIKTTGIISPEKAEELNREYWKTCRELDELEGMTTDEIYHEQSEADYNGRTEDRV